jgi:hypothetical protein
LTNGLTKSEKFGKPGSINWTKYYLHLKNKKNVEQREIPPGGEQKFTI